MKLQVVLVVSTNCTQVLNKGSVLFVKMFQYIKTNIYYNTNDPDSKKKTGSVVQACGQ